MLQVSERSLLYNVSGEAEGDGLSLLSAVPCLQRVPAIRPECFPGLDRFPGSAFLSWAPVSA